MPTAQKQIPELREARRGRGHTKRGQPSLHKDPRTLGCCPRSSGLQILRFGFPGPLWYEILRVLFTASHWGVTLGTGVLALSPSKVLVDLSRPAEGPVGEVLDPHFVDVDIRALLSWAVCGHMGL